MQHKILRKVVFGDGSFVEVSFGKNSFGRDKFFLNDGRLFNGKPIYSQVNSMQDAASSIRSRAAVRGGIISDTNLV